MTYGNKSTASQSLQKMNSCKDREIDSELSVYNKAKRKSVIESQGNCLTCIHTETQSGIYLICNLKQKKVRQYNYCEHWHLGQGESK